MTPHTFRIACPSWRHVRVFLEPSLREGRPLALRLPFEVSDGDALTLELDLPNDVSVAIDAIVARAARDDGGRWSAKVRLVGLDAKLVAQLREMMADDGAVERPEPELVEVLPSPAIANVADGERERFQELAARLVGLRGQAAFEALGLDETASVAMVEAAVRRELTRVHPDALGPCSRDLAAMGRELCIELERIRGVVIDRLSASRGDPLRRAGVFLCAANIDDWHSRNDGPGPPSFAREAPRRSASRAELSEQEIAEEITVVSDHADDGDEESAIAVGDPLAEGLAHLDAGRAKEARAAFAAAVKSEPRNRELRALYHVAYGRELIESGDAVRATTQFEAAIVHDPDCARARRSLDALRGEARSTSLWKRLFGGG